jgi:glutamyl/glutaminyl-tRNA synthetase
VHAILAATGQAIFLPDEDPVNLPHLHGPDYTPLYPLAPVLTSEKVVMDHQDGVTILVRGVDLMTEYSLYQFYCRCLGYAQPRHIYVPRLKWAGGDMSKTYGCQTISDMRFSGYTPGQVRDRVAKACLYHAPDGWNLANLRTDPRLI